jgi:Tol biopolymer transport system component
MGLISCFLPRAAELQVCGAFRLRGTAESVQGVGFPAYEPSIARKGARLVYTQSFYSDNIWRLAVKDDKSLQGTLVNLTSSRGVNRRPSFSPDGKKIVFDSDRLGYAEIWYCDSDGSNCAQLTSLRRESGTARWSLGQQHIAFESQNQGHEDIFVIDMPGGRPLLVPTFPGANNGTPNWSRDGHWIYFSSDHDGTPLQLWKVPLTGGPSVRVTKNGGVYAVESDDGRFLYYSKLEQPGIWRMPLNGGEKTRILDQPSAYKWFCWALTRDGIYFLSEDPPNGKIKFFDFATRKTVSIFAPEKPAIDFGGLAVSPDGRSLLYNQVDSWDSYIMLVKNFR